jgi:hypothetical protein
MFSWGQEVPRCRELDSSMVASIPFFNYSQPLQERQDPQLGIHFMMWHPLSSPHPILLASLFYISLHLQSLPYLIRGPRDPSGWSHRVDSITSLPRPAHGTLERSTPSSGIWSALKSLYAPTDPSSPLWSHFPKPFMLAYTTLSLQLQSLLQEATPPCFIWLTRYCL